MSSQKHAEAIYRDFEKLYRLSGLYKGDVRQIQQQLSFINNNLNVHMVEPFGRGASLRFDLLMSSVYFNGEQAFKAKTPEFTLSYALFYEGVKSINFLGGLTAEELFEWVEMIKKALRDGDDLDSDSESDLASVLWRKSSPNIKVALYNRFSDHEIGSETQALQSLDFTDDSDEFEAQFVKEVLEGEFGDQKDGLDKSWNADGTWDLPGVDLIVEKLGALGLYDRKVADRLKQELSDAAVSDRAKKILRFIPQEIQALRREMESYDENQVDFNLLVHYLGFLEKTKELSDAQAGSLMSSVKTIIQAVIKRFHAGLLLFTFKRFRLWKKSPELSKRFSDIEQELRLSLSTEKNLEVLAEAFANSSRQEIAKELILFCDPKYFQYTFNILIQRGSSIGQRRFLDTLIKNGVDLEKLLPSWGEKEILVALSELHELKWPKFSTFVAQCLRARSPRVIEKACEYLEHVVLPGEIALKIFTGLRPSLKRKWLIELQKISNYEGWKDFVKRAFDEAVWRDSPEDEMALWFIIGFKVLGSKLVASLDFYVKARKFWFWPKYPKDREVILSVAVTSSDRALQSEFRRWIEAEKKLIFQSAKLRSKLKGRF